MISNNLNNLLSLAPFSLAHSEKEVILNKALISLTKHHIENCIEYEKITNFINLDLNKIFNYVDLPFLPVRLFKQFELLSVPKSQIIKTMTSSGTTGQSLSKIFLDRSTSTFQIKVLTKIVSSLIGNQRLPMVVIDSPDVIGDRSKFSARGAGIIGFSMFGNDRIFCLNSDMSLNIDLFIQYLSKHKNSKILLFGFTYIVWLHFYQELINRNISLDLSNCILIHGGGWKKLLIDKNINAFDFKRQLYDICGIRNVYDYYGMVEQTGTINIECSEGFLHPSIFSDIIIRDPFDFSVVENGKIGLIEVVSILPYSYPGHILLTEDEGIIYGVDNCKCGKLGKYFKVLGRVKNAEKRGCSDTYVS